MTEENPSPGRLNNLPPQLLSLLLSAGPGRRPTLRVSEYLSRLGCGWSDLADDAERHVVSLILYQRLREMGLVSDIPGKVFQAWEADARHARLQHAVQLRAAVRISRELARRSIKHAFLKGFAYRLAYYDPPWVRLGGDIDLLIEPGRVELVRRTMYDLGFIQASCAHDYQHYRPALPHEIAYTESRHHEMGQFVRNFRIHGAAPWLLSEPFKQRVPFAFEALASGPTVHCCIDIHWALHFIFAAAQPLASVHSVQVPGIDTRIPVLSREWNIIFSAFKLYVEAFERPRFGFAQLTDLVALASDEPDWKSVSDLADEFKLDAALYYTLSAAEKLAGRTLMPADILADWAARGPRPGEGQGNDPAATFDFGDFTPFLVGVRVPGHYLSH